VLLAPGSGLVMTEILLLCTANLCRSPMAAALLGRDLAARDATAQVRSAGTLGGQGQAPPPQVLAAMAGHGLDLGGHRGRQVTGADLARAGLVVAMGREHLRQAVVVAPDAWPRTFTLRELVRRAGQAGARPPGEPLARWLARLHDGRSRLALLGGDPDDDVADPTGGPSAGYRATAAQLRRLTADLAALAWPAG
jgi:protein-tyrosine phosphatase